MEGLSWVGGSVLELLKRDDVISVEDVCDKKDRLAHLLPLHSVDGSLCGGRVGRLKLFYWTSSRVVNIWLTELISCFHFSSSQRKKKKRRSCLKKLKATGVSLLLLLLLLLWCLLPAPGSWFCCQFATSTSFPLWLAEHETSHTASYFWRNQCQCCKKFPKVS